MNHAMTTTAVQQCAAHPHDLFREGFCGTCLDDWLNGTLPDEAGEPKQIDDWLEAGEPKQIGGWLARAETKDLPVFGTHNGAFAYTAR